MLFSRVFASTIFKCRYHAFFNNIQLCLSRTLSVTSDVPTIPSETSDHSIESVPKSIVTSTDDSNEWLWSYLRDRKTFAELNVEQRRRVVEIGLCNDFDLVNNTSSSVCV
jgi:hypothetical protein